MCSVQIIPLDKPLILCLPLPPNLEDKWENTLLKITETVCVYITKNRRQGWCQRGCHVEFSFCFLSKHGLYQWIFLIREEEKRDSNHWNQLVRMKTSPFAFTSPLWHVDGTRWARQVFDIPFRLLQLQSHYFLLYVMSSWVVSDLYFDKSKLRLNNPWQQDTGEHLRQMKTQAGYESDASSLLSFVWIYPVRPQTVKLTQLVHILLHFLFFLHEGTQNEDKIPEYESWRMVSQLVSGQRKWVY